MEMNVSTGIDLKPF